MSFAESGIKKEQAIDNGYKAFNIYGGVASVYRLLLDLDCSPLNHKEWLFYEQCPEEYRHHEFEIDYSYPEYDAQELLRLMKAACDEMQCRLLPKLHAVSSLEELVRAYSVSHEYLITLKEHTDFDDGSVQNPNSEGLLLIKLKWADDGIAQLQRTFSHLKEQIQDGIIDMSSEQYETMYQSAEEKRKKQLDIRNHFLNDTEIYAKIMAELERRKAKNLDYLRKIGLMI